MFPYLYHYDFHLTYHVVLQNIYIMTDFQCANIFVYIGSEVPIEVLRQSLIAAEEFSWSIELEHKIPRVSCNKLLFEKFHQIFNE